MSDKPIDLFARTIRGIEWIAAAEIEKRCHATITDMRHREIRFRLNRLDKRLQDLGSIDDVFVTCATFDGLDHTRASLSVLVSRSSTTRFAKAIAPLRQIREIPRKPSFEVIASFLGRRRYNRYEIEDALGELIRQQTGWRLVTNRGDVLTPLDLSFRIHLSGQEAVIGARLTDAPMHRRPYKVGAPTATLHPPLAFAIAMFSSLHEGDRILDPFCGAGTIPIEALRVEPRICTFGIDFNPDLIVKATGNAQAANVHPKFFVGDAAQLPFAQRTIDRIISNPPWGRTVETRGRLTSGMSPFFEEVTRILKPTGRVVLLMESVSDHLAKMEANGLRLLLETPISVSGRWVRIALLTTESNQETALFDSTAAFGTELNKYWKRWPSVFESTS